MFRPSTWPERGSRGPCHGRRPWSSPEFRGQHGRVLQNACKLDEEIAGEMES